MNRTLFVDALGSFDAFQKLAFVGGAPPGPAGGAPPMDPAMAAGGAPPMDPAMAGGGAPPMDPAMAGGGAPPMDPAMAGGMPPEGMPPELPSEPAPAPAPAPASDPAEIEKIVEQAVQRAMQNQQQQMGAGGEEKPKRAKGKANIEAQIEALYRKTDVNNKLMRSLVDTLGIPIPPSVLDDPPPLVPDDSDKNGPAGAPKMDKPKVEKGDIQGLQPLPPAYDKAAKLIDDILNEK